MIREVLCALSRTQGEGDGSVVKNGGYPVPPATKAASPGAEEPPEGKIFPLADLRQERGHGSHIKPAHQGGALAGDAVRAVPAERWKHARCPASAETADTVATDQDTAAN